MINVLKSLFVWLCFIPAAILNGGFRQHVLAEYMGNACAMALSGVLLSLFILLISCFLLPRVVKLSRKGCLIIGGLWMILTVVFEVVFSMSAGLSFSDMLVAYNPMTGNLWLLVVLTTFFAPLFVYKNKTYPTIWCLLITEDTLKSIDWKYTICAWLEIQHWRFLVNCVW